MPGFSANMHLLQLSTERWKPPSYAACSRISTIVRDLYGGIFEYENKKDRLAEVTRELEDSAIWSTPQKAQELGRERAKLDEVLSSLDRMTSGIKDAGELLEMAIEENDAATLQGVENDVKIGR